MSEHFLAAPIYTPPSLQELAKRDGEFDRAHTRYIEVKVPPGGEHTIDDRGFVGSDTTELAYLRTSAESRGDVDALHIEDVHAAPLDGSGESRQVYGRKVSRGTDFLLVNGPQAKYGQEHPESSVRGFAEIPRGGNPVEYGREADIRQDFGVMGSGTSRRHFSVEQPKYGKFIVRDLGSTHGLAISKRIRTAADGTPVRQPERYLLDRHDLEHIDTKLGQIDAAAVPQARKETARKLVAEGVYKDISVDYELVARSSRDLLQSREFLADVVLRDPEVANTLVEKHIVGLHGTRSIGLLGIIQTGGMMSAVALRKAGYPVLAGEHAYQYDEGQKDISFASLAGVQRTLQSYAASHRQEHRSLAQVASVLQQETANLEAGVNRSTDPRRIALFRTMIRDRQQALRGVQEHPNGLYAQMLQHDFPVLIGICRDALESQNEKSRAALLQSEAGLKEFRIAVDEGIPLRDTPVVAVPKRYVDWVAGRMHEFGNDDVVVVPIEPFVDPEAHERHMRALAARRSQR